MPRGHEPLILTHGEQRIEILAHPILGIALCQIAQNLRRNRSLTVIWIAKGLHHLIPNVMSPVHWFIGRRENREKSLVLQGAIL